MILDTAFDTLKPKKVKQPWETEGVFQRYLTLCVFIIKTFVTLNIKTIIFNLKHHYYSMQPLIFVKFYLQRYYSRVEYLSRNKFQYIFFVKGIM